MDKLTDEEREMLEVKYWRKKKDNQFLVFILHVMEFHGWVMIRPVFDFNGSDQRPRARYIQIKNFFKQYKPDNKARPSSTSNQLIN